MTSLRMKAEHFFDWIDDQRRRIVDGLALILLTGGVALVVVAFVRGHLGHLRAGEVVDAGSVLAAAGGLLLGLGPHKSSGPAP